MNTQEPLENYERLYNAAILHFNLKNLSVEKESGLTILCHKIVLEHQNDDMTSWLDFLGGGLPSIGL
jgi:hypothetical protein